MWTDPKISPLRGAKNRPKPSFLGVSEQIGATIFFGLRPKNVVAKQGGGLMVRITTDCYYTSYQKAIWGSCAFGTLNVLGAHSEGRGSSRSTGVVRRGEGTRTSGTPPGKLLFLRRCFRYPSLPVLSGIPEE